jgi:glycosyltransferase involved in cell wall biosynthesis
VPSFNHRSYLAGAVESILAQSFRDFHVYLVDDASTDGSQELIRELVERHPGVLDAAYHATNRGIPARLQTGLEHCDSEYFTYLDGDDVWEPEALETLVAALDRRPEAGLVHSNVEWFDDASGRRLRLVHRSPPPQGIVLEQLLTRNFISATGFLVRRRDLRESGVSLRDAPIRLSSDYYLWLGVAARSEITYVDRVLGRHRIHAGNASHGVDWEEHRAECIEQLLAARPELTGRVVKALLEEVRRLKAKARKAEPASTAKGRQQAGAPGPGSAAHRLSRRWPEGIVRRLRSWRRSVSGIGRGPA